MKEMPDGIKGVVKKYNLNKESDFWTIGNNWIITHDAVTKIAEIEAVEFDEPKVEILQNDGSYYRVAMWGKGRIIRIDEDNNDFTKEVWTTADATRDNVRGKGGYFFNMCEKRWQDRLVLKLLNLYEQGLYSDVEAEDFKKNQESEKPATPYMKNNIRQIFGARGDWTDDADTILKSLSKVDGQRIKDMMEDGHIEEAVVEFYKLKKGE